MRAAQRRQQFSDECGVYGSGGQGSHVEIIMPRRGLVMSSVLDKQPHGFVANLRRYTANVGEAESTTEFA